MTIQITKNQTKSLIMGISFKELKKNRLTPVERFILETIDGAKPEIQQSGNVWWYKDGKCLFQQDFEYGYLFVNYHIIWIVLVDEFGLNYNESQELINNVMYDYTNNGSLTVFHNALRRSAQMCGYTDNGKLKIV